MSDTVHTLYAGWNAAATLNNKNISGYHNEGWYKDKDLKTAYNKYMTNLKNQAKQQAESASTAN